MMKTKYVMGERGSLSTPSQLPIGGQGGNYKADQDYTKQLKRLLLASCATSQKEGGEGQNLVLYHKTQEQ